MATSTETIIDPISYPILQNEDSEALPRDNVAAQPELEVKIQVSARRSMLLYSRALLHPQDISNRTFVAKVHQGRCKNFVEIRGIFFF